jgi:phosphoribosylformylglycinamidine cyclo-ligase
MVDYIAIEEADPVMLEQLAKGLADGAKQAGISISGGEIAQMRDVIKGAKPGAGFDLAATAFGKVDLDRINIGSTTKPGDLVLGVESNGIHSNGLSLARRAFFELGGFEAGQALEGCRESIGAELLRPTYIYVSEILEVIRSLPELRAMVHVTGDGFLNLTRVDAPVGFVIDKLPAPPGVFDAIQRLSGADAAEMFQVFNMGIGFCLVVDPADETQAIEIIKRHGKACTRIGHVVDDAEKKVLIEQYGLIGEDKRFTSDRRCRPRASP